MKAVWGYIGYESMTSNGGRAVFETLLSAYLYSCLFPEDERVLYVDEALGDKIATGLVDKLGSSKGEALWNILGNYSVFTKIVPVSGKYLELYQKGIENFHDISRWITVSLQNEPWIYVDCDWLFFQNSLSSLERLRQLVLENSKVFCLCGSQCNKTDRKQPGLTYSMSWKNAGSKILEDLRRDYPEFFMYPFTDDIYAGSQVCLGTGITGPIVGQEELKIVELLGKFYSGRITWSTREFLMCSSCISSICDRYQLNLICNPLEDFRGCGHQVYNNVIRYKLKNPEQQFYCLVQDIVANGKVFNTIQEFEDYLELWKNENEKLV